MSLDVMQERQQAHAYLDRLPPTQFRAVRSLLETMVPDPVARSIAAALPDEEPLTEEEDQALDRAEAWLSKHGGEGIPHEEVLAEFGLSMKDFPLKK